MLLPPDLCDWVPDDDMVHFVIEAVEGMSLPTLKINHRAREAGPTGCAGGSPQYPPKMMLELLVYCYANGIFSSRRIERATYRDIAVRFLSGHTHPDHDTICTFRRENFEAVSEAFLQVLQLARAMKVLKVGTVSVDGTHIAANASKDKNVRYDRAGELDRQLQRDIAELVDRVEQADQREEDGGQSIPKEIARRERLRDKMQQARRELEERAKSRAETQRGDCEKKVQDRDRRQGFPPVPASRAGAGQR